MLTVQLTVQAHRSGEFEIRLLWLEEFVIQLDRSTNYTAKGGIANSQLTTEEWQIRQNREFLYLRRILDAHRSGEFAIRLQWVEEFVIQLDRSTNNTAKGGIANPQLTTAELQIRQNRVIGFPLNLDALAGLLERMK